MKKNSIRYSKALGNFICDKIEDGICLAETCRKFPKMPAESSVYDWKKMYPEFKKQIDAAYVTFFYKKIDEIEMLSKEPVPEGMDKMAARLWLDSKRIRIDTLKFTLGKLAPKLVPDLRDMPTTAIGITAPTITIMNYSQASPQASSQKILETIPETICGPNTK